MLVGFRMLFTLNENLKFNLYIQASVGWGLDDEGMYPLPHRENIGTTDNTPFTNLSNHTYYAKRQTIYGKPSKLKVSCSLFRCTLIILYQQKCIFEKIKFYT